MDAPRRFCMKHNRNGLGFYDGVEEDADGYLMTVAEHERLMAEARNKALEDAASMLLRKFSSMGLIEDFAAAIRAMKGDAT